MSQQGFSADISQNSLLETSPKKHKEQRQKQLDISFFLMSFPFLYIWILCNLLLLFTFCQVCLLIEETAEMVTGMAEKSSWDQANIWQNLGLVWRNRKKISQIIKDYFYLPFFLLIIFWREQKQEIKINHGETFGGQGDNRSWRWDTLQPQHSSQVSQHARVLSSWASPAPF